jgi:hypothetical protein
VKIWPQREIQWHETGTRNKAFFKKLGFPVSIMAITKREIHRGPEGWLREGQIPPPGANPCYGPCVTGSRDILKSKFDLVSRNYKAEDVNHNIWRKASDWSKKRSLEIKGFRETIPRPKVRDAL